MTHRHEATDLQQQQKLNPSSEEVYHMAHVRETGVMARGKQTTDRGCGAVIFKEENLLMMYTTVPKIMIQMRFATGIEKPRVVFQHVTKSKCKYAYLLRAGKESVHIP